MLKRWRWIPNNNCQLIKTLVIHMILITFYKEKKVYYVLKVCPLIVNNFSRYYNMYIIVPPLMISHLLQWKSDLIRSLACHKGDNWVVFHNLKSSLIGRVNFGGWCLIREYYIKMVLVWLTSNINPLVKSHKRLSKRD